MFEIRGDATLKELCGKATKINDTLWFSATLLPECNTTAISVELDVIIEELWKTTQLADEELPGPSTLTIVSKPSTVTRINEGSSTRSSINHIEGEKMLIVGPDHVRRTTSTGPVRFPIIQQLPFPSQMREAYIDDWIFRGVVEALSATAGREVMKIMTDLCSINWLLRFTVSPTVRCCAARPAIEVDGLVWTPYAAAQPYNETATFIQENEKFI
jgi:hypothetical protein